jgi:hypothetical protein
MRKRNPSEPREAPTYPNTKTSKHQNRAFITVINHFLIKGLNHQIFTISQTNPTISKHHDQPHRTNQVCDGVPDPPAYAELSKQQAHRSKFSDSRGKGNTGPNPRVNNSDTSIQA